jgi:lipid-A-disaccharide synthase
MKYFIIAGEPSGDLHGSNLILNLFEADPAADIVCWGGDLMSKAGGRLVRHYRETAFMGVWEVMVNIRKVGRNFSECRRQIDEMMPDVVILIDYPGFNLRMARFAKKKGIRVYYYISPKFWAWREGRVKLLKRYVDRLYIIFPFETEFFRRHGYTAHFLGNPLIDQVEAWRRKTPEHGRLMESLGLGEKPVMLLMAGSRLQEIAQTLPEMVRVVSLFPEYQFVVAGMDHLPVSLYDSIIGTNPVKVVNDRAYDLLSVAEAALVTSGTATLEAALFGVPQVVCYRTSRLTYALGIFFLKVRFISLVNLIMGREAVTELIQGEMNRERLHVELEKILSGGERREAIRRDYEELRQILGGEGASARIASDMVTQLKQGSMKP